MSFDHPWLLLLILAPLSWAAWEWRESSRRLALTLKAAAFVLIALSLSSPRLVVYQSKVAVVVLGFHPALSGMRYELATPLLFANLLRWISPETFRRSETSAGSVGAVKLVMEQAAAAPDIKVSSGDGTSLPFTLRDRTLTFFSGAPGGVRVVAGDREYLYSLSLPELWDTRWTAPTDAKSGIPHFAQVLDTSSRAARAARHRLLPRARPVEADPLRHPAHRRRLPQA